MRHRIARYVCALAAFGLSAVSGRAAAHAELDELIAAATRRIEERPNDPEAWIERAGYHLKHHMDLAAAESDLAMAESLDPDRPALWKIRARLKWRQNKTAAAHRDITKYLDTIPDDTEAWILLSYLERNLSGPLAQADALTTAIATAKRPTPELYHMRAQTLARADARHIPRALAGLDEGIARFGPIYTLQDYAVELELKRGDPDAALARLDTILRQMPRSVAQRLRRAQILEDAGRFDLALECFHECQRLMPEPPSHPPSHPGDGGDHAEQAAAIEAGIARLDRFFASHETAPLARDSAAAKPADLSAQDVDH